MKHLQHLKQFALLLFAGLFLGNGLAMAAEYQPNLVVNGDFSQGNTGFYSEYTYVAPGGDLYDEGTYAVDGNPTLYHSNFMGAPFVGDNFLMVNGATQSGKIVWQQSVPVDAGKEYMFSMMVSSLVADAPANLEITIYINGVEHDQVVVAPGQTNVWKNFTWFSDEDKVGHEAEITIVETSGIAYGNDFGIDDIQFKELVTCAYSMGYWFAKPGVAWPYDVELGGEIYTQVQGAAFWPPANTVNIAFSQYAAIYLSGITLEKFPELESNMQVIDAYFAGMGVLEHELQEAAGWIGAWIDANNCNDCTLFNVDITVVPVSCYGGSDGRILVEMDGATPANICLYNECTPENMNPVPEKTQTAQFNNKSAGWYFIVIVDANGCLHYECVEVPEPLPLAVAAPVVTDALCNGTATGTATITVSGGNSPYMVNGVEFAGPQYTFTDLAAGDYAYELNDANACGPVPVAFEVGEPLLLVAEVETVVPVSCYGGSDGSALVVISGGTAPYFYNEVELDGDELQLLDLSEGIHEVMILDANDCEVIVKVEVTEPDPLVLDIDVTNVTCFGGENGEIVVDVTGGTGMYKICHVSGCDEECTPMAYDAKTGDYDYKATGLKAGKYSITVVDENGCVATQCVEITQPTELTAKVEVISDVLCFGEANGVAVLTVEGGTPDYVIDFDYDWNALEAGDYEVIVTDANGCGPVVVEFTIDEPELLVATVEILNHVSCYGLNDGVAELTIAGGYGEYDVDFDYDWDALVAGEYTCVVTDENGCTSEVVFEITQPNEILLDIDVTDVSCFDGSDGIISVDVTADYDIAQICFLEGCVVPVDGCLTVPEKEGYPDAEFGGMSAGWYTIVVVDVNGCIAYECVEIIQPDPIAVTLTYDDILCFGGTTDILVEGEGGTGDLTLIAVDGDTEIPVGVLPVTVPDVLAGTLNWIVRDANGCEFFIDEEIVEPLQLVVIDTAVINVTCFGGNNGQAWFKVSGGTPPYTSNMGIWEDGWLKVTDLCAGEYSVEVYDANNCMIEPEFTILDGPEIFVELVEVVDVMCYGSPTGSIEVLATGGNGGFTYSLDGVTYQATGLFENLLADCYTVYVMDAEGCVAMLEKVVVAQPEELVVELEVEDVSCYGAADGQISGYITGGVGPYYTCLVTFCADDYMDDGSAPDKSQGFVHYDLEPGKYTVMVMDQNGCQWYQCVTIGEPDLLEVTVAEVIDVKVYGEATGEATVAVVGGVGPYTYLWSDGQTAATATGLVAGKYCVVVTDANGCEAKVEVTICQPDETSSNPLSDGLTEADDQVSLRAYPNPFTTEATIEFELRESGHVTLEVYNIVGEKVAELFEGHVDAFVPHKVTLQAGSMPNGIYFYRLNNGNKTFFNKVVLSR